MIILVCPDCGALIDQGFIECPVCEPEAYQGDDNEKRKTIQRDFKGLRRAALSWIRCWRTKEK